MVEIIANILILAFVLFLQLMVRRLEGEVEQVHVAVNSNLSEAQEKLNHALVSIEKLETKIGTMEDSQ